MSGLPSSDYVAAHASDNKQAVVYGVSAMLLFLATAAVVLRFIARHEVSRRSKGVKAEADDYLALLALVSCFSPMSDLS